MTAAKTQTVTTTSISTAVLQPTAMPNRVVRRKDYVAPEYFIKHAELSFLLDFDRTNVEAILHIYRNETTPASADLILDGAPTLLLKEVRLAVGDGAFQSLSKPEQVQELADHRLRIAGSLLPKTANEIFKLHTIVNINPTTNTELMGLYKSGPMLCTQCEAEGFRRITYYLDRPDVMATFKVRLEADQVRFPVLLSNGNEVDHSKEAQTQNGRHYAVFEDPFPKPSYLFAIVAGDLASVTDTFVYSNGKQVKLALWCEPADKTKLSWAMESVKKAMKWDQNRFGRIYDLDQFHVVAVSHFNMGAMENKGLNVFNSALLLALPTTATDTDYARIMAVVGHEYFHNWTGNRITCRDWFQLTLKEGLTVYRDQEFSSDLGSRAVERIQNVNLLRSRQFAEDAGPMSHPIRPEAYQEIDNFYTMTVYRKGAEVIRMYETLLGRDGFRKGMDLYFERHDGQAVTCDEFLQAMSDANDKFDLNQFSLWYSQAGTPLVTVNNSTYDAQKKIFEITLSQECPVTPADTVEKRPFHIPIALGLIGKTSKEEVLPTTVLHLKESTQTFRFDSVEEPVTPSILRNFSAPVKIISDLKPEDYGFLFAYDTDPFNRWEACQKLMAAVILQEARAIASKRSSSIPPALNLIITGVRRILEDAKDPANDRAFLALCLDLPPLQSLQLEMTPCDPIALYTAAENLRINIAKQLEGEFEQLRAMLAEELLPKFDMSLAVTGSRALKIRCTTYLTLAKGTAAALDLFRRWPENLTLRHGALLMMSDYPGHDRELALQEFREAAKGDRLVLQKWMFAQARSSHDSTIANLGALVESDVFQLSNPNDVRAVYTAFAQNFAQFHRADGAGYRFLSDAILKIDKVNGRMAASLVDFLIRYKHLAEPHKELMRQEVVRLNNEPSLGAQARELVGKALMCC